MTNVLIRLHGNGNLLRAVCRRRFAELVETPEIMTVRLQEKWKCEKASTVKSS